MVLTSASHKMHHLRDEDREKERERGGKEGGREKERNSFVVESKRIPEDTLYK